MFYVQFNSASGSKGENQQPGQVAFYISEKSSPQTSGDTIQDGGDLLELLKLGSGEWCLSAPRL